MEISRKVLCVDDEINVLEGLKRQLRNRFALVTAQGGEAGLAALAEQGPFAAVVADYNMPGINGVEFLRRVHERSPETVNIMLTGRPELDVAVSALHDGHIRYFLQKPCPPQTLVRTLTDALEQYRLVWSERLLTRALNERNEELRRLNEQLEERVAQRTNTIRQLHAFVIDLNGLDTLEGVARLVVERTSQLTASRRVAIMLPAPDRGHLMVAASWGIDQAVARDLGVSLRESISGRVFTGAESIVIHDPEEFAEWADRDEAMFFVGPPLVSALLATPAGPVGVLNVADPAGGRAYDPETLNTLRAIAEAAAIALRNQIRLRERNEARDAVILAMARLAENRDPETGAHLERVQEYCRMIAQTMARMPRYAPIITHAYIEDLVRSSPLHDIGKVGIPDQILLKPGRLTPEEFEIMKRHAVIGGDTIRTIIARGTSQDFLAMGMEIAYAHHEKYNGRGYPRGLRGDQIPLCARIVAVADVYDALTSRRVYKEPMPHEKAVAIIREDSGEHFDPDVVAAFLEREDDFRRLAAEMADEVVVMPPIATAVPAPTPPPVSAPA